MDKLVGSLPGVMFFLELGSVYKRSGHTVHADLKQSEFEKALASYAATLPNGPDGAQKMKSEAEPKLSDLDGFEVGGDVPEF